MKFAKINTITAYELLKELSLLKDKPYDFIANLQIGEYDSYFSKENLLTPVNEIDQFDLPNIGNRELNDFEFGKIIYEALKDITLYEAHDKRLWMYLSLFVYRKWSINRGKYKSSSTYATIKENLFFEGSSAVPNYSNHISRLWWAFKRTEISNDEDKYKYTRILLGKGNSQIWFDLSERKDIWRNKKLVESIIEFYDDNAHKFSSKTDFSGLLIPLTLNHLKSFSLIDYKKKEIKEILNEFIDHQKENGGLILKG
jgi:hypothetical protein